MRSTGMLYDQTGSVEILFLSRLQAEICVLPGTTPLGTSRFCIQIDEGATFFQNVFTNRYVSE